MLKENAIFSPATGEKIPVDQLLERIKGEGGRLEELGKAKQRAITEEQKDAVTSSAVNTIKELKEALTQADESTAEEIEALIERFEDLKVY